MIDKKCSIITDDEGFVGIIKIIDSDFIHIEMDNIIIAVPKLRIKSIVYSLNDDIKIPKKRNKKPKIPQEVISKISSDKIKKQINPEIIAKIKDVKDNPFLDSIKRKLGESGLDLDTKIGNLNISVVPLAEDSIDYSTLKKQSLNDFIPNQKSK